MKFSEKDIDSFKKIFAIPGFMTPWLDRFFDDSEIELVLLLAQKPLTINEIAEKWTSNETYRHPDNLQDFRHCREIELVRALNLLLNVYVD